MRASSFANVNQSDFVSSIQRAYTQAIIAVRRWGCRTYLAPRAEHRGNIACSLPACGPNRPSTSLAASLWSGGWISYFRAHGAESRLRKRVR
jgi:hypothetical protein